MLHETEDLQEMVEAEACWEAVLRECRSFKYTKIGYRVQTIESKSFYQKIKKMLFSKRKFANLRSTFVPHMCSRKSREAVKIVESCQLY